MNYRPRRRRLTSTIRVGKHICKVFIDPWQWVSDGTVVWKVGFAVGRSRRQINDWYYIRRNRRSRSLHKRMTGTEGFATIPRGFYEVLRLRWQIPAGDTIFIDCTSANPDKQYKTFSRWRRWHPDWYVSSDLKEFYWTKPLWQSEQSAPD